MKIPMAVTDLPASDIVPAGEYEVVIEDITGPHYDKNENEYMTFMFTIKSGEYCNRKFFENYVRMDDGSLFRRICEAAFEDISDLTDTDELIGVSLRVVVGVRDDKNYGEQNKIRTYIKKRLN